MIRPISQLIALLGLALLVLHRTGIWGDLQYRGIGGDVVGGILIATGVAGLLLYGARGYTSARRVEKIDPM